MRAVVYLRVSTEEQATSGLGLEAQQAACEGAVAARAGELVRVVADEGVSGSVPAADRPGVRLALDLISTGEADTLVVAKLDGVVALSATDILIV